MKLPTLITLLLTLLFCAAAHCQEAEEQEPRELEIAERQMHQRERQLDLEERESELDFRQAMHKLDVEQRNIKLEWLRKKHQKNGAAPLLILFAIVHILTAIWVYQDIRKRGVGSGIWIVIALLTGLIGTLVYAIVRLGNTKPAE